MEGIIIGMEWSNDDIMYHVVTPHHFSSLEMVKKGEENTYMC